MDSAKATRINLLDFKSVPMRTFHMTWFAFLLCFMAWFGIAPLMVVVRKELSLTPEQIKWCMIGSVAITVLTRLLVGWLCDRLGPRLTYTWLLVLGSIPVVSIGFANSFEAFLLARVLIGAIGASFVITQYHTSVMFAPNVIGTANATTAGWGNLGGGVTQLLMPALLALFVGVLGFSEAIGWRLCMVIAGVVCFGAGVAYYLVTQDCPEGNYRDLRAAGRMADAKSTNGTFLMACRDYRSWALFVAYGACFGIELTIENMAATYFHDYFGLSVFWAGATAATFGMMSLFARTLGGLVSDRVARRFGMRGRVNWLFIALFCQGLALVLFAHMNVLLAAIPALMLFGLFVKMSEGATFAVVPFVNRQALGSVSGIVGAGGNAGAVAAGFLFTLHWPTALTILGVCVSLCSFLALTVRFAPEPEAAPAATSESEGSLESVAVPGLSQATS